VYPGDLARGCSDLEMTWLLCCAGAATELVASLIVSLCPCTQPIVMHLGCVLLHLSMPEALVAATINAAASLGKSHTHGSLEVGKLADMVVIDAPRYRTVGKFTNICFNSTTLVSKKFSRIAKNCCLI